MVVKITQVEPGLIPPQVITREATWDSAGKQARLEGEITTLGDAESVQVGFQYRRQKRAIELYDKDDPWKDTDYQTKRAAGSYQVMLEGLEAGREYEVRTVVRHPLITLYGAPVTVVPE